MEDFIKKTPCDCEQCNTRLNCEIYKKWNSDMLEATEGGFNNYVEALAKKPTPKSNSKCAYTL